MIGPIQPTPAFQTRLDMWAAKLEEVRDRLGECDMCSRPASIIYTHPVDESRRLMAVTLCAEHLHAGFRREVRGA